MYTQQIHMVTNTHNVRSWSTSNDVSDFINEHLKSDNRLKKKMYYSLEQCTFHGSTSMVQYKTKCVIFMHIFRSFTQTKHAIKDLGPIMIIHTTVQITHYTDNVYVHKTRSVVILKSHRLQIRPY